MTRSCDSYWEVQTQPLACFKHISACSWHVYYLCLCTDQRSMRVCTSIFVYLCLLCISSSKSLRSSQEVGAGVTWDKSQSEYERRRSRDGGWFCGRLVLHRDTRARATDSDGGRHRALAYGAPSHYRQIHRFNTACCFLFVSDKEAVTCFNL